MEGHLFKDASTHHGFLIAALKFSVQDLISTDDATDDYNGNTLTKVVGSNTTSYAWDYENRRKSRRWV